jgi:hypothetical protein
MMMKKWLRGLCHGVLVGGISGVLGCAPVEPLPPPPSTPVSVSTLKSVAGTWAGVLYTEPPSEQDDWATLTIYEDGSYDFVSVRTIGILHAKGTLKLSGGKLRTETERGSGVVTLYEKGGRRMLKLEGAAKDGMHYSADLDQTK